MFIDYELLITSKILMKKLGFLSLNKNINININDYYLYYLNPNFFENIKNKNFFVFIGYNLRLESPILNIKLRKKKIKEDIFYYIIGSNFNDNLNCKNIGLNIKNLINYLQGKSKICNLILKKLKKLNKNYENILNLNMFLLGNNIVLRSDNKDIINLINNKTKNLKYITILNNNFLSNYYFDYLSNHLLHFLKKCNINININILYLNLSILLYQEFNYLNNIHNIKKILNNDIIYLFGLDDFKLNIKSKFYIFQGHHINLEYLYADLIFPSVTFLEKSSDYLNIEGSFLQTNFILYPPVFCRND